MSSQVVCLVLLVLACVSLPQASASEQETVAPFGHTVSVSRCMLPVLAAGMLFTVASSCWFAAVGWANKRRFVNQLQTSWLGWFIHVS
jgi:hypothetical protein